MTVDDVDFQCKDNGGGVQSAIHWTFALDNTKWEKIIKEYLQQIPGNLHKLVSDVIAVLFIVTIAASLSGEWLVIVMAASKQLAGQRQNNINSTEDILNMFTAKNIKMENFVSIWIISVSVTLTFYYVVGGFLHWYYYVKRRHLSKEWKLQPDKWLSPELEWNAILVGSSSMVILSTVTAFLACHILNGNPSTMYFQFDEYGWWWFYIQFPALFLFQDYAIYIVHRLYHTRWFYKNFHKVHHKYKYPTAFAATALHPVESLHMHLTMFLPLFVIPVHWMPFVSVVTYNYYHGMIDHSGINFKRQWWQPWQHDAEFHDKHHEFFHCNFGLNTTLWDRLHGTLRLENRVYTEETFHGEALVRDTNENLAVEEDGKLKNKNE